MSRILRLFALSILLINTAMMAAPTARAASPEVNLGHFNGLAMNGYDVMTYWRGGNPQKGDPEIAAEYNGATWVFLSDENRQAFLSDPAKFAPQFGGYCAYAASQNAVADVDPIAWRIWDDKLYLNYSIEVRRLWANKIDENIDKANGYWPNLLQQ
ncbi:YHS domain-containing (seleno)protein [Ruegeria sp. R14_0]|uniref:YHS domain-containing (seleno)protein n=1 Tax=Ruegeria sp. R14_0 TaxID=2821100 RepID=UPI001ADADB7D|nr:YHS domain-containing (seleno)protein [Ruegeria sp. R14_0]MBO9448422.1 YHS domain protein [Ruegeria sp. R14_0]